MGIFEYVIIAFIFVSTFGVGVFLGFYIRDKTIVNVSKEPHESTKVEHQKPSWDPGDLLDPIRGKKQQQAREKSERMFK